MKPVGGREPFTVLDVRNTVLQISVSFCQVNLKQCFQQVFQLVTEVRRTPHLNERNRHLKHTAIFL